ncbi:hypothetical protein JCM1393_02880 [Clostridium carnis]
MAKIIGCSIIIKDDFNNVLIARKKVKKNEPKLWYIFGRTLRGKETTEKCINRAIKEDLKSIIFDLAPLKEYVVDETTLDSYLLYTGSIKERVTTHADIVECKWVSERNLDDYDFAQGEKEKIISYYNN